MPGTKEITYLVLADRAAPYLLARVRWPDVAQAISANCPDWLDDPGLFDLPYDPGSVRVSFSQAASVAASWGRQIGAEPAEVAPTLMRRMPANWSDLTPAERKAYGLESARGRGVPARRLRRLRAAQEKWDTSVVAAAPANAHGGGPGGTNDPERRRHLRVPVDGRVHIASGPATISAALVDLSEGGVRCVLPDAPPAIARGSVLAGPFLLEAEVTTPRICLAARGRVHWHRAVRDATHFGVAFDDLDDGEVDGVHQFMVAAGSRRGSR